MIYRTRFELDCFVNDFEAAKEFLETYDDMTKRLKQSHQLYGLSIDSINKIVSIKWILEKEWCGHIDVISNSELTTEELNCISDFVKNENMDGIGEDFEEEEFAHYFVDDWDDSQNSGMNQACFDWERNDYTFEYIGE